MEEQDKHVERDSAADEPFNSITDREVALIPLKHFFNIDSRDFSNDNKLEYLLKWANEKGLKTRGQLMLAVKQIERKLGAPNHDEGRVTRIYRYLQLDNQLGDIMSEMQAYERSK